MQLAHWLETSANQTPRLAVRKVEEVQVGKQTRHRLAHCGHGHLGEVQQTQAGQGPHLAGAVDGEDERVEGEEEHPEVGGIALQAERDGSQPVLAQVQDDGVGQRGAGHSFHPTCCQADVDKHSVGHYLGQGQVGALGPEVAQFGVEVCGKGVRAREGQPVARALRGAVLVTQPLVI